MLYYYALNILGVRYIVVSTAGVTDIARLLGIAALSVDLAVSWVVAGAGWDLFFEGIDVRDASLLSNPTSSGLELSNLLESNLSGVDLLGPAFTMEGGGVD